MGQKSCRWLERDRSVFGQGRPHISGLHACHPTRPPPRTTLNLLVENTSPESTGEGLCELDNFGRHPLRLPRFHLTTGRLGNFGGVPLDFGSWCRLEPSKREGEYIYDKVETCTLHVSPSRQLGAQRPAE